MKILFVLEYYHPHIGGVESLFKGLVENLAVQGHQVTVLTNRHDKKLSKIEASKNITIHRYDYYNRYVFTFFAWIKAYQLSKNIDIIHTTSYNAAIPAWIAAKIRKKHIVITFHEYWGDLWFRLPWMSSFTKVLHASFEKLLVKLNFEYVVAVSDFTKEALQKAGVKGRKIYRIYNGIDYEDWPTHKSKIGEKVFTYFGRVGYSKGLDLLVPAIALIKDRGLKCKFQLVTSRGPLLQKLLYLIEINDVSDMVILRHELEFEQLKELISESYAIIIPSYSEGFCFAAVESMAIGTPIISSDQGALSEVVTGQFIKMKEFSIKSLFESIESAHHGRWEYAETKKFPLVDTIRDYNQLYNDIYKRSQI